MKIERVVCNIIVGSYVSDPARKRGYARGVSRRTYQDFFPTPRSSRSCATHAFVSSQLLCFRPRADRGAALQSQRRAPWAACFRPRPESGAALPRCADHALFAVFDPAQKAGLRYAVLTAELTEPFSTPPRKQGCATVVSGVGALQRFSTPPRKQGCATDRQYGLVLP